MLDNFLNVACDFFALDFEVLANRQWWDNELAMNTYKNFEEIAQELAKTREILVRATSFEDPRYLNYLVNINKEINTLTNHLITIGKESLYYNSLNSNGDEVKGLLKAYSHIEKALIELDNKLVIGLNKCYTSPEILNSGNLDLLRNLHETLVDSARQLFDSNILQEIRNGSPAPSVSSSTSSAHSFSSSTSASSSAHSSSRIIQELQNLPNGFRIP